ncbi:MAG: GNAT family N-acetyltransferase [candidate division KSB1 bacterium]|nr:GNAT family N-acetyltransferase [candidate division KSB1 bacterium]MDZ7384680.1 GNAT family N-acetyltransferase [candidate division KSB1 bacterium]MDZ7392249.1 GNAT family N-acetyltransferase [candidate division KSB1 bacterium]MDZ7412612.1 GNAT family N-acetyltransferase [candidate division KSB1 bacterium]
MQPPLFLNGSLIHLRPVDLDADLEMFYRGENDPLVRDALFLAFPVTRQALRSRLTQQLESREAILFTICTNETGRAVGVTAFFRIDYVSRAAVFYLALLDSEAWGKGYGGEATRLMVDYAFATLNLNRIQLHVCAENTPAIRIYEKAGFVKEGVLRQAMYRRGGYVDFWVMGILREDWERNKAV